MTNNTEPPGLAADENLDPAKVLEAIASHDYHDAVGDKQSLKDLHAAEDALNPYEFEAYEQSLRIGRAEARQRMRDLMAAYPAKVERNRRRTKASAHMFAAMVGIGWALAFIVAATVLTAVGYFLVTVIIPAVFSWLA